MSITQFFLSPKGRIPRSALWLKFVVPYIVLAFVFAIVDVVVIGIDPNNPEAGAPVFSTIFMLAAIWPSIAVLVKRSHDRNRTGWFVLLFLIPILNLWPLIELYFLRGTDGENKYGSDPLA